MPFCKKDCVEEWSVRAERLGVIYTSGGIGDHLLALPALRALLHSFQEVKLVCIPGSYDVFFKDLPLSEITEVKTVDQHGREIGMRGAGPIAYRLQSQCEDGTPAKLPAAPTWGYWSFDVDEVVELLHDSNVLVSLTPWHSPDADEVSARIKPQLSVGFSTTFERSILPNFNQHVSDLFFQVIPALDLKFQIDDFIGPSAVSAESRMKARNYQASFASGCRVLAVHADTISSKMWSSRRFVAVLDNFLEKYQDFMALVVGTKDLPLYNGRYRSRVNSCLGLSLGTSLALVEKADVFLGVDSCMLHCADLKRVPSVGLFGTSDFKSWGGRFAPHVNVCGNQTMLSITVNEVNDALEKVLVGL